MDDKKNTMKRVIAIIVVAVFASAAYASAQSSATSPNSRPLADVAKDEEARRKAVKKPAKVYTNDSLRPDTTAGVAAAPPAQGTTPAATAGLAGAGQPGVSDTAPANAAPAANAAPDDAAAAGKQDQAYWQNRIKGARAAVARSQLFADSLQTRINSLLTDFVNRDNPVEKAKIEQDRNAALAELEKVKKEIEAQQKTITAIEDEARRAGVPPGWLRPGA
jgi:hypothetical protein